MDVQKAADTRLFLYDCPHGGLLYFELGDDAIVRADWWIPLEEPK
jgi:hypothetical protein